MTHPLHLTMMMWSHVNRGRGHFSVWMNKNHHVSMTTVRLRSTARNNQLLQIVDGEYLRWYFIKVPD